MTGVERKVVRDAEAVATLAAELLAAHAGQGHHIALAGGSTPKRAYRLATERLEDWSRATLLDSPPRPAWRSLQSAPVGMRSCSRQPTRRG